MNPIQHFRRPMSLVVVGIIGVAAVVAQQGQLPQPTDAHEQMAREAGVWDANVKMWHAPDADPMESKATETNKMFGKFWLTTKFQGDFGGMDYIGHGQFGYDPIAKKCVGIWVDTWSPYMQTMEGNYDLSTHTLTMNTEGRDHESGKIVKGKNVTTYIDNDTKKFEMYMTGPDGKMFKTMEINYKRRAE